MSASGSPMRPIGFCSSSFAAFSGLARRNASYDTEIAAGQITFAQMPWRAHSRAAVRVSERSASFAVLYSAVYMCAFTPLSEHTFTIRPHPALRMCRKRGLHRPDGAHQPHAPAVLEREVRLVLESRGGA